MPYLELALRLPALRTELRARSKGIVEGFWRLYTDDFFDIAVPIPPKREQVQIVGAVSEASEHIDALSEHARTAVGLLNEYRTRLISDVVTGKLDVRQATAGLDEEAVTDEFGVKVTDPDSLAARSGIAMEAKS